MPRASLETASLRETSGEVIVEVLVGEGARRSRLVDAVATVLQTTSTREARTTVRARQSESSQIRFASTATVYQMETTCLLNITVKSNDESENYERRREL